MVKGYEELLLGTLKDFNSLCELRVSQQALTGLLYEVSYVRNDPPLRLSIAPALAEILPTSIKRMTI